MARYLSTEWVRSFDAALSALDLSDAVTAAGAGSLVASDGTWRVAQIVTGVPGESDDVRAVLSVAAGHAHLTLEHEETPATATIVLAYADARAMALGELDPADALAAGRVRVRGDLAALVAGQEILAAATAQLGSALADLTDPADSGSDAAPDRAD